MSKQRVAIAGATGYAGEELIRWLLKHPSVQLTYLAASAKWERPIPLADVAPRFARRVDLPIESLDPARLLSVCDCVFLALPHGEAMALAPKLLAAGKRVIDLSGDFRLRDAAVYPRWYARPHASPELLADRRVVYGLTEFHRAQLPEAKLVANPGCYATSILLACLPLFDAGVVEGESFIVDAKSGLSGAGRKAQTQLLFAEMTENLRAYKVNEHQHLPEILQEITHVTARAAAMVFVPQVIPVHRGLISMCYLRTKADRSALERVYAQRYAAARTPFVRVRAAGFPELKDVADTNYCDIGFAYDAATSTLMVASALDNLVKGAAGQAIQNFNLMYGLPETTGLL